MQNAPRRRRKTFGPFRQSNRLKDKVYRQMYLLESGRPGSEMGLALALLQAWNDTGSLPQDHECRLWLRHVCPVCVKMIEDSRERGSACGPVVE